MLGSLDVCLGVGGLVLGSEALGNDFEPFFCGPFALVATCADLFEDLGTDYGRIPVRENNGI